MWLASASLLFSQSAVKITGRVVDARTSEPLPGANVQVLGSALGAATNSAGRFEIENLLNGQYTLKAAFIGYQAVEKDVLVTDGQPVNVFFQLEQKVIEMESVGVTAFAGAAPSSNKIILTRRDIERTQASTVGDLLRYVPGVDIQESGAQGEQKISIRGSRSNQVLVLLDGVKLNDELTGDVDLSVVPVNSIERIEVHKGSASAEFGGGAVGGVITIFSADSFGDNLRVQAETGSYGFQNIEPSFSAQFKNINLIASFQAIRSSGAYSYNAVQADDVVHQQTRLNADMWSQNFYTRLGYTNERHRLSFRYQKFESERGNPGRIYYLTPFARSFLNREIWGGDYNVRLNKWMFDAQFNYAVNRTQSSNLKPLESDMPFGATPQFHFDNSLNTIDGKAALQHQTTKWLEQRFGYEQKSLRYSDSNLLRPGQDAIGSADDRSYALFFKQDYQFTFWNIALHFSPALRFDEAHLYNHSESRVENQLSPHVSGFLAYGTKNQIFVKANVGRAFRMPTFADLFYQDFRVQGKADVLPEKSLNREIGCGAQFEKMGKWRFEVSTFRNTINDMIVWRLGSFEFFRPYNTDAELLGEEYSLSWQFFADFFQLNGSYTHVRPLNKNDNETLYNKHLPYRPEHSVKIELNANFDRWRMSILYRHIGQRFVTEANTKSMPAYAVLDWTTAWTINFRKLTYQFQCAVFNVLDEQYQIIRDMPLPGREWRLGLSVKY